MSWSPFITFPREMGFPMRSCIVYTIDDMVQKINKWNTKCDIFASLYALSRVNNGMQDYDTNAMVTHMFFDLDNHGGKAHENVNRLHSYLVETDIMHRINFSGDGFHVYIAVKYPNFIKNKRVAIDNAITTIAGQCDLKIGIHDGDDIDARTVGNVSQLVRLPNSYNPKRKRFCIPLQPDEVKLTIDEIRKLAEKQRLNVDNLTMGKEYIELEGYDGAEKIRNITPMAIDVEDSIGIENIDINSFPACVKSLLLKGTKLSHGERYIIITYLREQGIPIRDTVELLRKYLPASNAFHCIVEERQPKTIYGRADLVFPSCQKLQEDGYCETHMENLACRRY